ncbi:MAG: hypothetical protein V2B20_07155 [Pseudomonadota bacterium]
MQIKLLPILLMLCFTGCSSVTSNYPVGLENYPVTADAWNGTWFSDEVAITIHVTDEEKGLVQLAWVEKNLDKLKFESVTCRIMKGRKWLYGNILETEDKTERNRDSYFWGKIKIENNTIVIWHPSVAAFRDAVAAKRLQPIKTKPNKNDSAMIAYISSIVPKSS